MQFEGIDIISPALFPHEHWNRAEVLGAVTWLWLHTPPYGEAPLMELGRYVLPALDNGQFALFAEQGSILGYFSWAMLSPETEAQYIQSDSVLHTPANWQSGSRIWIVDWFAPYGDSLKMKTLTRRYLFSNQPEAYALYHRAGPGKAKVVRFADRRADEEAT